MSYLFLRGRRKTWIVNYIRAPLTTSFPCVRVLVLPLGGSARLVIGWIAILMLGCAPSSFVWRR
jgi:hypothetical protein